MLLFFFFFTHLSNMVTEHQTTDYRITYTRFFPKRRTDTAAARGQEGGQSPVSSRTPSLLPRAGKILLLLFFFLLFFGKSKFVKPQNQMRIPLKNELFSIGTHARTSTTWPSGTDLQTELASDIQTPPKKQTKPGKRHPWLPSAWCWTWIHTMTCLLKGVWVCRSYQPACRVCECIQSRGGGST